MVWASLVQFFELISFFAVASLFAWLGYAPLQRQLVKESVDPSKEEKASKNLIRMTDYFLVSFLFYSGSAIFDYILHRLSKIDYFYAPVYLAVGVTFLFGTALLLYPMFILRGKGVSILGDIDPPHFMETLGMTWLVAGNVVLSAAVITTSSSQAIKVIFVILIVISIYGSIRHLNPWGRRTPRSYILNLMCCCIPFWMLLLIGILSQMLGGISLL